MKLALGLLALLWVGEESPLKHREVFDITYDVRVLTLPGLEWRGTYFERLQKVATQGGAAVWTASHATAEELTGLDPNGAKKPSVATSFLGVAHISDRANHKVPAGLTRLPDGPFHLAAKLPFAPSFEDIREGYALTLAGRKIDQGVLTCVVLDNTRVSTVHHVKLSECAASGKSCCAEEAADDKKCCEATTKCSEATTPVALPVPEVAHTAVTGEWLIPNESALVVSLGVQTVPGADGKAVTSERLLLIEARPAADGSVKKSALAVTPPSLPWSLPLPGFGPTSLHLPVQVPMTLSLPLGLTVTAHRMMPMPAMPSRSLPEALSADGRMHPLPPLPEEHPTPSSLPGSSEPCASPQVPNRKPAESSPAAAPAPAPAEATAAVVDPGSTKASFLSTLKPKAVAPAAATATVDNDLVKSASRMLWPSLLRLPFPVTAKFPIKTGNFNVEVEIRFSPPDPSAPCAKPEAAPAPAPAPEPAPTPEN
jgi:hypothetical protein